MISRQLDAIHARPQTYASSRISCRVFGRSASATAAKEDLFSVTAKSGLGLLFAPRTAGLSPGGSRRGSHAGRLGSALATPLGALLFDVGRGDSFKDWYFPEGGQEGGRKLQGNRAYTVEQAGEMAAKRAAELEAFLAGPSRGSPEMDARAREDATRILAALERI